MDNQHQKIKGCRDLTAVEIALMNEAKALSAQVGAFIDKLRAMPTTNPAVGPYVTEDGRPSIDQRWVSIGATDLQKGFMSVIRGIAQPSTF